MEPWAGPGGLVSEQNDAMGAADTPLPGEQAMEIHKPKPFHTLREFLKEYAIIVLGVATALAAEQTVEYLHHRSELRAVRIDLEEEKKLNIATFRHGAAMFQQSETYLKDYLATLRKALKDPAVPLPGCTCRWISSSARARSGRGPAQRRPDPDAARGTARQ